MTEENHCYENAMAERVNGILKQEYGLDETFNNEHLTMRGCERSDLVLQHGKATLVVKNGYA